MLNTGLTSLIGLAAAATLTVEAEGCRIARLDIVHHPVMADLVRRAASIELARIGSAEAVPDGTRGYASIWETHAYHFETIESLKGEEGAQFTHRASYPFQISPSDYCLDEEPDCQAGQDARRQWQAAHAEADSGRFDWSEFRYRTTRPDMDGMGGIAPPMPSDRFIVGCGQNFQSFEIGQTYLVFRDADGVPLYGGGLNFQLITREDDRWLEAVQYFIENPDEDWLPAIPAREAVSWLRLAHKNGCGGMTETGIDVVCGNQLAVTYRAFQSPANSLPGLPEIALPISDGMVDLSGIPSQHAIEPSLVPLDDVIAWLSDTENETPQ